MIPGKKDFVSVLGADGKRVHQQKSLQLREAYSELKVRHDGLKVGFSKFAQLRPKECIIAGGSGTHSICVCTIHQNVKLMMAGSRLESLTQGEIKHYWHSLAAMQCNPPNVECFLATATNALVQSHFVPYCKGWCTTIRPSSNIKHCLLPKQNHLILLLMLARPLMTWLALKQTSLRYVALCILFSRIILEFSLLSC